MTGKNLLAAVPSCRTGNPRGELNASTNAAQAPRLSFSPWHLSASMGLLLFLKDILADNNIIRCEGKNASSLVRFPRGLVFIFVFHIQSVHPDKTSAVEALEMLALPKWLDAKEPSSKGLKLLLMLYTPVHNQWESLPIGTPKRDMSQVAIPPLLYCLSVCRH